MAKVCVATRWARLNAIGASQDRTPSASAGGGSSALAADTLSTGGVPPRRDEQPEAIRLVAGAGAVERDRLDPPLVVNDECESRS
eukprot:7056444-Prorocentrum_lima.AAC.1